jgi:gentisate 1,2-dioxygenase
MASCTIDRNAQVVSVERRRRRLRLKDHPSVLYGMMRPAGEHRNGGCAAAPLVRPSQPATARRKSPIPTTASLDYIDPLTGGPTPTLLCRIQLFRPNEKTQSHRHRSTSIYHVFRGSGTTTIDGKTMQWEQGDSFVVPLWAGIACQRV